MMQSSKSVGAENLISLIKNYSRNGNIKTAVTVGVIGYPNTGKVGVFLLFLEQCY